VEMSVILAVEMSTHPFKTFRFDGILGLGLGGLAMSDKFSAFQMLLGTGLPAAHFGVFLTEGEDGETSEIAMGGVDERRILEPLSWAPVAMAELGYWQVRIQAVRVNGVELDVCKDGTCRGVVDTGTSHLGVPGDANAEVAELLTTDAGDLLDCRLAAAPEVEIELEGYTLTLQAFNYMRRLPLREGVSVSSAQGVYVPSNDSNATASAPPAASNATGASSEGSPTGSSASAADQRPPAALLRRGRAGVAGEAGNASQQVPSAQADGEKANEQEEAVRRFCRPRLMPVRLPEPLGPKLFILGEPVLHRYYTVYDWANHRVGFSLANNRRNTMDPAELAASSQRGALPKEVDMLLMQKTVRMAREVPGGRRALAAGSSGAGASSEQRELQEESMLVQVKVRLTLRQRVSA